jgi:hypothetical protein
MQSMTVRQPRRGDTLLRSDDVRRGMIPRIVLELVLQCLGRVRPNLLLHTGAVDFRYRQYDSLILISLDYEPVS